MNITITDKNIYDIMNKGWTTLALPRAFYLLSQKIVTGMEELSSLPSEDRIKWSTDRNRHHGDPDENLVMRNGSDKDSKLFFHYRKNSRDQLENAVPLTSEEDLWLEQLSAMQDFLHQNACAVWKALSDYLYMKLRYRMDVRYPLCDRASVLRVLRYINDPMKEYLAKGHLDLSALTFVLPDMDQSHNPAPGLFLKDPEDIYIHNDNEMLVFLGIKAEIASDPTWDPSDPQGWNGDGALLQSTMHGAAKVDQSIKHRFTIPYFAHCSIDDERGNVIGLDDMSIIGKRIAEQRHPQLFR